MTRVLLRGFEPFHKASTNPTQEIVRAIDLENIEGVSTAVLPVEFGKSSRILIELIEEIKPEIVELMKRNGTPASIFMSAGTYVCNHVFYSMQNHCLAKGIKSGSIHVPLVESQSQEFSGLPTLPLNMMIDAIKTVITHLMKND